MTLEKLCKIISLPEEVIREVLLYAQTTESVIDEELKNKLLFRNSWDDAVKNYRKKSQKIHMDLRFCPSCWELHVRYTRNIWNWELRNLSSFVPWNFARVL